MQRRPLLIAAALAALGAPARAQKPPAGTQEITWDDLMPKDWDPLKDFKDINLGMLQDGDPKAVALLNRMREVWDKAPTNPAMEGRRIRLPGYIVPLEEGKAGMTEFLLVPYFGACIHTPPPPANQIVHVFPTKPAAGFRSMEAVWVDGTLKLQRADTYMGTSGYRLEAVGIERYVEKK